MYGTRPLTSLALLAVVGTALGAVWSLTGLAASEFATAGLAVLALVVAAVLVATVVGRRAAPTRENPYW
ncbi:hypothetical protein [Halomarina ordinaria]|uniref:Major facilitator superfamily (MFS) profile domain-containing protein n=1 Tax=Halomarina ordinaria TaxID=3033939 RepID=A0ABD5U7F1_9EURY|nr:hypothetical protein [Halomarina sp. PSRA2]